VTSPAAPDAVFMPSVEDASVEWCSEVVDPVSSASPSRVGSKTGVFDDCGANVRFWCDFP
jgi:hypothetical protein